MNKGLALHIGVNRCDPEHYNNWEGRLSCCEGDAEALAALTKAQGFAVRTLKTLDATRTTVISAIEKAAKQLKDGDLFVVSFSGHGGQLPDRGGDEVDNIDETWCLYDGHLLDDELANLWAKFQEGARILVLSDSCHSGSVIRGEAGSNRPSVEHLDARFMPMNIAMDVYAKNSAFYDKVQREAHAQNPDIQASVLLISGCKDEQYSYEGWGHGLFTSALLDTWSTGTFDGNYEHFHQQIASRLPKPIPEENIPGQEPQKMYLGREEPEFYAQRPFSF